MIRITFLLNRDDLESSGFGFRVFITRIYDVKFILPISRCRRTCVGGVYYCFNFLLARLLFLFWDCFRDVIAFVAQTVHCLNGNCF